MCRTDCVGAVGGGYLSSSDVYRAGLRLRAQEISGFFWHTPPTSGASRVAHSRCQTTATRDALPAVCCFLLRTLLPVRLLADSGSLGRR